ncbi:MAG: putative Ig domain-containing protein [Gammaproteobacteria bacterium]|nr:putative Ig domain-containing protein [Gammaproteobacteria bacterium]
MPVNHTPLLSGTPPTTVLQGDPYDFRPSASDPDGDALTFSIQNRPSWASFSTSTGRLSGTPGAGDVGTSSNVRISVTDGQATTSLAAFDVTVQAVANGTATLSWTAPTRKTDGSPLTDLGGFRVYWGRQSGSFQNVVTVSNPGITTYVIDNLTSGTWYFATTAFDSSGLESDYSNVASKTIP